MYQKTAEWVAFSAASDLDLRDLLRTVGPNTSDKYGNTVLRN